MVDYLQTANEKKKSTHRDDANKISCFKPAGRSILLKFSTLTKWQFLLYIILTVLTAENNVCSKKGIVLSLWASIFCFYVKHFCSAEHFCGKMKAFTMASHKL